MKRAFVRLIESSKFWTAIVGVVVALGAKYGLDLDKELVASIVGLFAILVGAQGAADQGRAAAEIASGTTQKEVVKASEVRERATEAAVKVIEAAVPGSTEVKP